MFLFRHRSSSDRRDHHHRRTWQNVPEPDGVGWWKRKNDDVEASHSGETEEDNSDSTHGGDGNHRVMMIHELPSSVSLAGENPIEEDAGPENCRANTPRSTDSDDDEDEEYDDEDDFAHHGPRYAQLSLPAQGDLSPTVYALYEWQRQHRIHQVAELLVQSEDETFSYTVEENDTTEQDLENFAVASDDEFQDKDIVQATTEPAPPNWRIPVFWSRGHSASEKTPAAGDVPSRPSTAKVATAHGTDTTLTSEQAARATHGSPFLLAKKPMWCQWLMAVCAIVLGFALVVLPYWIYSRV